MKKITLVFLIFAFISCKKEGKNQESIKDEVSTEKSRSEVKTVNETTSSSLGIIEPVKWFTEVNKLSETDYELIMVADIDPGFYLYSQVVPDNGPLPTVFIFENSDDYELIGKVSEEEGRTTHDPIFDMDIKSFEKKAVFKQLIKVKTSNFKIVGEIEFMACNDSQCLNGYGDVAFEI